MKSYSLLPPPPPRPVSKIQSTHYAEACGRFCEGILSVEALAESQMQSPSQEEVLFASPDQKVQKSSKGLPTLSGGRVPSRMMMQCKEFNAAQT